MISTKFRDMIELSRRRARRSRPGSLDIRDPTATSEEEQEITRAQIFEESARRAFRDGTCAFETAFESHIATFLQVFWPSEKVQRASPTFYRLCNLEKVLRNQPVASILNKMIKRLLRHLAVDGTGPIVWRLTIPVNAQATLVYFSPKDDKSYQSVTELFQSTRNIWSHGPIDTQLVFRYAHALEDPSTLSQENFAV